MSGPLTDKQERPLLLFKKAIEGEQEAQKLYAEMLLECEDPGLRPTIE
jgi:rubrerythrin